MTTILTVALNVKVTKDALVIAKFALMRMNVSLVIPKFKRMPHVHTPRDPIHANVKMDSKATVKNALISMSVQKTRTTAIKTPLVRILKALMNVNVTMDSTVMESIVLISMSVSVVHVTPMQNVKMRMVPLLVLVKKDSAVMVLHALIPMNVLSVFTTVMTMLLVSICMVLMNVLVTTDSLETEKTALMLMNVKLKIHAETMVFARTLKDLTVAVVTMVLPESVALVETSTNARSVITDVQSMLIVPILTVHTTATASLVSQELDFHVSILMSVRLVTMTVTRMRFAKILMAITNARVLMVSWVMV